MEGEREGESGGEGTVRGRREGDALEDLEGTVSIGGRTVTNLRFADDIDGLAR